VHVDRVTATIRYSQDSGKGAWKSVEVGAEATVAPDEDWQAAQQALYITLGEQLKTIWGKGVSKVQQTEPDWAELGGNHRAPLKPPPAHYCETHQCPYKRFEKNGQVWYSHKAPDGAWCKEVHPA
jgi:hypothetical protein